VGAIDMSFMELTIQMWVAIVAATDDYGYLLFKGSALELDGGLYTKGYEVRLNRNTIVMSVYAGGGRIRSVSLTVDAGLPLNDWHHITGVYRGDAMELYLNGDLVSNATFEDKRPGKINMYDHPLTIGYGFTGFIDDLVMWRVARSAEEIKDTMHCPPALHRGVLDDIAAYFTFNEGAGNETLGHGYECPPLELDCLKGTVVSPTTFAAGVNTAFQFGRVPEGVGYPSAERSFYASVPMPAMLAGGTGEALFQIHARDKCGYDYHRGEASLLEASVVGNRLMYFQASPPVGRELPIVEETGNRDGLMLSTTPNVCPGTFSDVYQANMTEVTSAGVYQLDFHVGGAPMSEGEFRMGVLPNAPRTFSMNDLAGEPLPGNDADSVAGVPRAIQLHLLDVYGNIVHLKQEFRAQLTILNRPYSMVYTVDAEDISYNEKTYMYTFYFTVGLEGSYRFDLMGDGMDTFSMDLEVTTPPWNQLHVAGEVPAPVTRFEHSSVVYDEALYIFGGASRDKTYLNDMWKYDMAHKSTFAYSKRLTLNVTTPAGEGLANATVEFTLNTRELVDAGRMRADCMDMIFVMANDAGEPDWAMGPIPFYLSPFPGCYSESSIVFLKVPEAPEGVSSGFCLYGGSDLEANEYMQPEAVFEFYEGFEATGPTGNREDSLHQSLGAKFMPHPPCGSDEVADRYAGPRISEELPYAGSRAMYFRWGEAAIIQAPLREPLSEFKMGAWLWDSISANSAHYMSPNFGTCDMVNNDTKARLPDGYGPLEARSVAVGTYTLSNLAMYSVASPWEKTTVARTGEWHHLEITSTMDKRLVVSIDGVVVKEEEGAVLMDKVLLSGGFGVDGGKHPQLAESHAFWDEVTVLKLSPVMGMAEGMNDDTPAATSVHRMWEEVDTKGVSPPPRYSHTAVMWTDKMVIFGGERSAHSFGDVWFFHFEDSMWEYIAPQGSLAPSPRFDHTAVVSGDKMYIYGGRSGKTILSDMWAFDLYARTWALVSNTSAMGERFGHAAAVRSDSDEMYMFGGYSPTDSFSDDFFRCILSTGVCEDMKPFCNTRGIPFTTEVSGRYAHTAYADDKFLYIYGGSNLGNQNGFGELFRLTIDPELDTGYPGCTWERVTTTGTSPARYEHAMSASGNRLMIHGGHDGGTPEMSVFSFPIA